eukprot:Transcript_26943.p2 GENE.Transcript_26943~~Transcript_26943.p2  ORF type:complete len:439 (+),score=176.22 Transcript_26943:419-1735(+)
MELQPGISLNKKRGWDPTWLAKALADPARPVFLAGCVPPREGTTEAQTMEIAKKFVDRARCLAADGFVVYDIQDEASRTQEKRPFPFSRTQKPEEFAALFPLLSGKGTVVYKSVGEEDERGFDAWLARAISVHGCSAFNLVGAASSSAAVSLKVPDAAAMVLARPDAAFGCVCIAERHLTKRSEHLNMLRKQEFGALWFISQAVYDADATVQLLQDYGELCRSRGLQPAKVVLSFAPCGRPKTMQFIKWLGIKVPPDVEARIVSKAEESKEVAVAESIAICCEALASILERSRDFGVPLGVNVESVSGFREEIDGVFELFRRLQQIMLDSRGQPWGVQWYRVPVASLTRSASEQELSRLELELEQKRQAHQARCARRGSVSLEDEVAARAKQERKAAAGGAAPPAPVSFSARPAPLALLLVGVLAGCVLSSVVARVRA